MSELGQNPNLPPPVEDSAEEEVEISEQERLEGVLESAELLLKRYSQLPQDSPENQAILLKAKQRVENIKGKLSALIVTEQPSQPAVEEVLAVENDQIDQSVDNLGNEQLEQIKQVVRDELTKIFTEIEDKVLAIPSHVIYSHSYQSRLKRNEVFMSAKEKLDHAGGVYDETEFKKIEAEVASQFISPITNQQELAVAGRLKEARAELEDFKMEEIAQREAQEILSKAEIHGSDFRGQFLTTEILKQENLLPKYKISFGESTVSFSSSGYDIEAGRIAVVAYVEKEGKVVARSYYRSNSQGVWRYLPNYQMEGGEMSHYDKGYGEESITVPIIMQKALSEITREGAPILKTQIDPQLIFAGTARLKDMGSTYFGETESTPKRLEGNFYPEDPRMKVPPEQVLLAEGQSPDFSKLLTSWEQKTNIYGQVTIEVFPSKDGKFKFIFCKDASGRAWIGGIEDDSETQSTGLKKSWISGGSLTTPAYEYKFFDVNSKRQIDQTGGYGNEEIKSGVYVDMFKNYLSKIPVIQEYLRVSSVYK